MEKKAAGFRRELIDIGNEAERAQAEGDPQGALRAWVRGLDRARDRLAAGDGAFSWYAYFAHRVSTLHLDQEQSDHAIEVARELWHAGRSHGSPHGQLGAALVLIRAYTASGRIAAAVQHTVSMPDLLAAAAAPPAEEEDRLLLPRVDESQIPVFLHALAQHVYYTHADYPACVQVCQALLRICPDHAEGAALLAFSLTRTGDHEPAVDAYRRAITLDPRRAGLLTGLSAALAELDRLEEALEAQCRAIDLQPDDPTYHFSKGNLLRALGDHAAAIAEYDRVLASLDTAGTAGEGDSEAEEDIPSARSVWQLPRRHVAALVAVARLRSLAEAGPLERVTEEARSLLESAGQPTRGAVHRILGDALYRAGRIPQACDAYLRAMATDESSQETRTTLCAWLVECGRIDEAVRELTVLADLAEPSSAPETAREVLAGLADRFPGHLGILRARGVAECCSGCPAQAVETLSQVLQQQPEDGWSLLWRGVALVSHSDEREAAEEGWNNAFSPIRIRDALLSLAEAAHLDGDHRPRARKAFGWLLERALWSPLLAYALMSDTPVMDRFTAALPGLHTHFKDLRESHMEDNPARRWSDAAAKLTRARAGLEPLGLPLLVAWADAVLADTCIRLGRLQDAVDALDRVDRAFTVLGLGPHQDADDRMDRFARDARSTGNGAAVFSLEHLELTAYVGGEMQKFLSQLRADTMSMLGHAESALDEAGGFGADQSPDTRARIQQATLLRNAGRYDEALSLLESLTDDALDPYHLLWRDNLRVTILMKAMRIDEAHTLALRTLERIPDESTYERAGLKANLAWILVALNRPDEALALLDTLEIGPQVSRQQLKTLHRIRGLALSRVGEPLLALAELRSALSIAEEFRQALRGLDARMSWQEENLSLYQQGMECALAGGDVTALFELLERSKAQAFLDQLDADRTVLDDTTDELRGHLKDARARQAVLRELADAPDPAAETELVHAYAHRGGRWSRDRDTAVTSGEPVTGALVAQRLEEEEAAVRRLEARYDRALVVGHEATADRVMGADEIAEQLRRLGDERVLLVEYLVMPEEILVFFLRAGDSVPLMDRIDLSRSQLADLVAHLLPSRTGAAARPLASQVLERLSPLAEPVLRHSRPGDVLWVVPHQFLHQVPLHAVPVDDGRPLLRTRSFCYTPSAAVLSRCQKARTARLQDHPAADRDERWSSALVLGDSRSDLPHSRFEAMSVAALFGTRALLGSEAKASAFLETVRRPDGPDVLHLACHGRFGEERALASGVVLAPEAGASGTEAVLTAEDIMRLTLGTDLVVLSACDSGRSEERAGDELIGLARALLQAGAPSVLVSLWPVYDLSTCLLMERFYEAAMGRPTTATVADALRRAQLAVADLTAAEVIEYCDRRISETDGVERTLLRVDRADIQILAGDLASAVTAFQALEEEALTSTSEAVRRIGDAVRRKLPLLRLRAPEAAGADYSVRPFSDPYYWASFVLVGDWR